MKNYAHNVAQRTEMSMCCESRESPNAIQNYCSVGFERSFSFRLFGFCHRLSVICAAHFSSHLFFRAKHCTYCVYHFRSPTRRHIDTFQYGCNGIKYLFSGRTYRCPFTMYPISLTFIATYRRRLRCSSISLSSSLHVDSILYGICIYNIIIINIAVRYTQFQDYICILCCSVFIFFHFIYHWIWFDFRWLGESYEPLHRVYRRELSVLCVREKWQINGIAFWFSGNQLWCVSHIR